MAGTHTSTIHLQPVFRFFSCFFPLFRSFIPLTNIQYCCTYMRRPYNAYYKANLLKFIYFFSIFKHMEHGTNTARNGNNFRKIFLFTNFFLFLFFAFEISNSKAKQMNIGNVFCTILFMIFDCVFCIWSDGKQMMLFSYSVFIEGNAFEYQHFNPISCCMRFNIHQR